ANGVKTVTLYLLSTDNLVGRDSLELQDLFTIISDLSLVLRQHDNWRVKHVGDASLLPEELMNALTEAEEETRENTGLHVNLAVGYGGRSEIAAAVHSVIEEHQERGGSLESLAEYLTPETIGEHL